MFMVIGFYLNGSYSPFHGIHIRGVVHVRVVGAFQLHKHLRQVFQCLVGKLGPQCCMLRHRYQFVAFQHRFKIQPCATTEDGHHSPILDVLVNLQKVALVFKHIVFGARFGNVNQMIGNVLSFDHIIVKVFPCTNIHAPIHLSAVGTDDFSSDVSSQCGSQCSLSAGRWAKYCNHFAHNPPQDNANRVLPIFNEMQLIFYKDNAKIAKKTVRQSRTVYFFRLEPKISR